MAQYKVPQDVEADDKLLGPFTFRQFIYLLVVAGLIAITWALFQLFPLLIIIPLPLILFFGALALPLKKDQPMETYLAAIVSFYLKPRKRFWYPGQSESTIEITAPKIVEKSRARDLSGSEASHRLSFLAEIVDSEGHAIKGSTSSPMREEFYAEATATNDMFDPPNSHNLTQLVSEEDNAHRAEIVAEMKQAINQAHTSIPPSAPTPSTPSPNPSASPTAGSTTYTPRKPTPINQAAIPPKTKPTPPPPQLVSLANDKELSIATIAKEANRRERKLSEKEVYISLH